MDKTTVPIIIAFITAGVTIFGWNISHLLAKRREDRTRRIESSIKQLERQFEEFYGPLHSLIEQIFNVWRVRRSLMEGIPEDKRHAVDIFVWKEYFLPLHVATQKPNGVCAQTSHRLNSQSLRILRPPRSHSLRMYAHCTENNAQTSVPAHSR